MMISILGGGWLGLPLARALRKDHGIKLSSRSTEKLKQFRHEGLDAYQLELTPEPFGEMRFFNANALIVAIPPNRKQGGMEHYLASLKALREHLKTTPIGRVIMISSTSVYEGCEGSVIESDAPSSPFLDAEMILREGPYDTVVLRCGGLMGEGRIAGKYFAGQCIKGGDIKVNHIHLDDVIGVIKALLASDLIEGTFNLCAPLHPTRETLYAHNAARFGFTPVRFNGEHTPSKTVHCDALFDQLPYTFKHPNPLEFPERSHYGPKSKKGL